MISTNDTKRHMDSCRNILVGKLPMLTDQIEFITLTLLYKFMADIDAEGFRHGKPPVYFAKELAAHHWSGLFGRLSPEERMEKFIAAIAAFGDKKKAAHLPAFFQDIFRNTVLKFRDGVTLARLLDQVATFTCANTQDLGAAIEYLLQCMGTQGENGQFHTPPHILEFITSCVEPRASESILDPACGTGGFLASAFKHIVAETPNSAKKIAMRGYDITELMVRLSKVNLFLNGVAEPDIRAHDTLTNAEYWGEKFDLILANPPFMTPQGGVTPHDRFRIPARKSEILFMEYIASHISETGRAAVIVPNGVCANIQIIYSALRRMLIRDSLAAVVSLPSGIFRPYSGVKTSILFLDRTIARKADNVLFLKINSDGYELGNKRRPTPKKNDLPAALDVLRHWNSQRDANSAPVTSETVAKAAGKLHWSLVPRKQLAEKRDASLSVERFTETRPEKANYPYVALGDVVRFASGGTPLIEKEEYWDNGTINWVSSRHINDDHQICGGTPITELGLDNSATRIVPAGTLLLVTRVCVGKWTFLDTPVAINQDITALTVSDTKRLLPEFMHCLAPGLATKVDAGSVGTSVRGVPRDFLKKINIPLPPLEEQRKIIDRVKAYSVMLDGARQVIGACHAGIEIDENWPRIHLGDVADFEYGHPTVAAEEGEIRYIRITDIDDNGRLCPTDPKFITLDEAARRHMCEPGDIYIARVGSTAGKTLIYDTDQPGVFGSYLIKTSIKGTTLLPKFFWYYSQTQDYAAQRDSLLTGSGQPQLNARAIRQIEIPTPPIEIQAEIVNRLDTEANYITAIRALVAIHKEKIGQILDQVWQ